MMMSITANPFTPVSSATPCITTTSTRSTNYALNSKSLFSNLVRDANLNYDILCEINNQGQNVNVKCSSGFYAAVSKPVLCSISNGHSLATNGIVSTVATDGVDTADTNGLMVNRLLKIALKTATTPPCSIGTLSIHLHHTSRLTPPWPPSGLLRMSSCQCSRKEVMLPSLTFRASTMLSWPFNQTPQYYLRVVCQVSILQIRHVVAASKSSMAMHAPCHAHLVLNSSTRHPAGKHTGV